MRTAIELLKEESAVNRYRHFERLSKARVLEKPLIGKLESDEKGYRVKFSDGGEFPVRAAFNSAVRRGETVSLKATGSKGFADFRNR